MYSAGSSQFHWYYFVKTKMNYLFQCKWRNLLPRHRPVNLSKQNLRDRLSQSRKKVKAKFSRYRPGVAQRVGRSIALLFHDHGTRRG